MGNRKCYITVTFIIHAFWSVDKHLMLFVVHVFHGLLKIACSSKTWDFYSPIRCVVFQALASECLTIFRHFKVNPTTQCSQLWSAVYWLHITLKEEKMYERYLRKEDNWSLNYPPVGFYPTIEIFGPGRRMARMVDGWQFDFAGCFGNKVLNHSR